MKLNNSHHYRPDIDGLRALAVIPVVIFHLFPRYFTGGYIGVDVFFVISGFLISSIIISNVKTHTFSFFDFYSKRIRRIYPALLTVVISCLLFGYFALFANEYKQLAKHVAGSSVFISNFILLFEAGYFDTASVTKPLLHLWSLGIEEQFYIIWPFVIYIAFKLRVNTLKLMLFFFALSFSYNIYEVYVDQSTDFYLPFTRFWELDSGAILAIIVSEYNDRFIAFKNKINDNVVFIKKIGGVSNLSSILGTLLLIGGYITFNETIAFPGFYALIPVLGACLLISSGQHAIVNKYILSTKIFIWIGLISYPIYLWHWPLISFSYIINSGYPPAIVCFGLIILTLFLSWFTYYFIERKLRYGKHKNKITVALFMSMLIVGLIGLCIYMNNGLEGRFKKSDIEVKDEQKLHNLYVEANERCSKKFPEWLKYTDNACLIQNKLGNNAVAIIGDSHAGHLFTGLSEVRHDGVEVFSASCALPFYDTASALNDKGALRVRQNAYKLINIAYNYVIQDKKIHYVILSHHPSCSYNDAIDKRNPDIINSSQVIENGMRRSLSMLVSAGKKVIIVEDNPILPYIPQACTLRPLHSGNGYTKCVFNRKIYDNTQSIKTYNSIVEKVIKDYPMVSIVDLSKILCDKNECYESKNGHVLFSDITHFNKYGSRYVAPYINQELK